MVDCPICGQPVKERDINDHIDSGCQTHIDDSTQQTSSQVNSTPKPAVANFFQPQTIRKTVKHAPLSPEEPPRPAPSVPLVKHEEPSTPAPPVKSGLKRPFDEHDGTTNGLEPPQSTTSTKRQKPNPFEKVAPLAERMRPKTLDEVCGQELVGPNGVIRGLIEQDRVPSMVLWGGPGTGKTTIARLIANTAGCRFVEINSTSSGVAECKKLFAEARSELSLTGRKTIIFCDEIHRFSKSQQDVFLGPVEAGHITLIGATTENPSFKVVSALLSRCRTFTLSKLSDETIVTILSRALTAEYARSAYDPSPLLTPSFLHYLSAFSDGDARTGLNLLELALSLSTRPNITQDDLKASLTQTLVYDRAGDQHFDTISALHKSLRGSDPDASLYYLARMLQSGEDPLYIARRLVVVASEDVGLADNTMLPLAIACYTACEKIGMPECRIQLAHCVVALALAPKSTRSYRALNNAMAALAEPGVAGLPVPIHLRNAPTRLMKELGYGREYKYNPEYRDGRARQVYLPEKLVGRRFLEERDLGEKVDSDLEEDDRKEEDEGNVEENVDVKGEEKDGDVQEEVLEDRNIQDIGSSPPVEFEFE